MARENKTRYALLGMLGMAPMTGYEIRKHISTSVAHFWNEGYGQIYPTLRRLTEEGLVEGAVEAGGKRPERVRYTLTQAGMDTLIAWITTPPEPSPMRNELLLKLFFGGFSGPEVCRNHLEAQQSQWRAKMAVYQDIEAMLREELERGLNPHSAYLLLTVRQGIHITQGQLAWCEESLSTLEMLAEKAPSGGPH